jgi:hypothetical protein
LNSGSGFATLSPNRIAFAKILERGIYSASTTARSIPQEMISDFFPSHQEAD